MDRDYWNALAQNFSADVLEISECDIDGVIVDVAKSLRGKRKTATDFGCGAGAVTRAAAPFFKSVLGVDFSNGLLEEARRRTDAKNVAYALANLGGRRRADWRCDVGFCVNVLITSDAGRRERIARNVISSLVKGGAGVFVVPALESALRIYQVALQCEIDQGSSRSRAVRKTNQWMKKELISAAEGVVDIGGAPTKHYLHDELAEFLRRCGLRDIKLRRVSYPWSEALEDAPSRLKAAPPWDWLAIGFR